jgi:hypothetical protein
MPVDPSNLSDPPDPPNSPNQTGKQDRRLKILGVILWLVVIGGSVAMFMFTDLGGDSVESTLSSVVGIGSSAIVAVIAGVIIYQVLKRLNLIGSVFINIFWGILLTVGLPLIGWFVIQESGIITSSVQTEIVESLPINQEARNAVTQLQELVELR